VNRCQVYATTFTCALCEQGFVLDVQTNTCFANPPTDPNCVYFSSNQRCMRCKDEFYLNADLVCTPVPTANSVPNCAAYNPDLTCLFCDTNYYLSGTTCVSTQPILANCISVGNNECLLCSAPYYPVNGQCTGTASPLINGCVTYASATTCSRCLPDYYLDSTNVCRIKTISNCYIFDTATTCKFCAAGFYLTSSNTQCTADSTTNGISTNCLLQTAANKCARCKPGYNLDANGKDCNVIISGNCEWAFSATECFACSTGYYLDANKICQPLPASPPVNGCQYNLDLNNCLYCTVGYYVSDGTPTDICTTIGTGKDIPNCVFYSPTGCAVCEGGFYLDTSLQRISQCVPLPVSFTNILNCQYYILQGTTIACQYCEFSYYLQTVSGAQQCTPLPAYIVANCESYDKQVCVKCIDGYFFNAATSTCDPVTTTVTNCYQYATATTCQYCNQNFYPTSPTCSPVAGNTPIANCISYSSPTVCQYCDVGYYLNGAQCTKVTTAITGCQIYDANQQCLYCNLPYVTENGLCTQLNTATCLYFADANNCAVCQPNYVVQPDGTCAAIPATAPFPSNLPAPINGCVQYIYSSPGSTNLICIACSTNFYLDLDTGTCVTRTVYAGIAQCLIYDGPNFCKVCNAGYYPTTGTPNTCAQLTTTLVPQCQLYQGLRDCYQCFTGYLLSESRQTCIQNCEVASGENCVRCKPNFYVQNGACVQNTTPVAQCAYYASNGVCQQCAALYSLSNNICTQDNTLLGANNCLTAVYERTCLQCMTGFYYDIPTKACVAIGAQAVPGCLFYGSDNSKCEVCLPNHYMNPATGNCDILEAPQQCCNICGSAYSF